MTLCKDCKFYNAQTKACEHISAFIPDFTEGNHRYHAAQIHRQFRGAGDCTPSAKFFEPAIVDITPARVRIA